MGHFSGLCRIVPAVAMLLFGSVGGCASRAEEQAAGGGLLQDGGAETHADRPVLPPPPPPPPPDLVITGVAHDATGWVAVGHERGTDGGFAGIVYRSDDGVGWEPVLTGLAEGVSDVEFGNGTWTVVAGFTTAAWVSADGRDWTPVTLPEATGEKIAFGRGRFVATRTVAPGALVSLDGRAWTVVPNVGQDPHQLGSGVAFAVDRFVRWGNDTTFVSTSDDGAVWVDRVALDDTIQTSPGIGLNDIRALYGLRRGFSGHARRQCCFGEVAPLHGTLASVDGITWTQQDSADYVPVVEADNFCVGFGLPWLTGDTNGLVVGPVCSAMGSVPGLDFVPEEAAEGNGLVVIGGEHGIVTTRDGVRFDRSLWR